MVFCLLGTGHGTGQVGTIVRCRVLGAVCLIDEGPLITVTPDMDV